MKSLRIIALAALALLFAQPLPAFAGGNELMNHKIQSLGALTATSVASGDYLVVYDASVGKTVKVDAGAYFAALAGYTGTAAELNYNDIATLGTGAASKAIVLDASGDYTYPAAYTGVIPSGGTETFSSGSTLNVAGTFQIGGTTVASAPLINPGRGFFNICGDNTTVNNNTVYYGPSIVLLASSGNGQTCDINEAGNVTEATADAPVFTNQAVQVLGMICRNEGDANADISYTLRTAAGATVPSVTCTIADGERDCVADVQTTTAIAAGATVAVAAASTADVGDNTGFNCTVSVAY